MATLRSRIFAIVGIVAGIITLGTWRRRRARRDAVEHRERDVDTAAEHAAAATEHARLAAKKAVGPKEGGGSEE